jgi:hypothetical protein
MGDVDATARVQVIVHHGGSLIGYKSDMMWLPGHGVGAVVLTNSDQGYALVRRFQRKLLEVLFDGKPEADQDLATSARALRERIVAERKPLTVPADRAEAGKLAARYASPALGELRVAEAGGATVFDVGEGQSPVATRENPDGTASFVTTTAGVEGLEFAPGVAGGKRTLVVRDARHEYAFTEARGRPPRRARRPARAARRARREPGARARACDVQRDRERYWPV